MLYYAILKIDFSLTMCEILFAVVVGSKNLLSVYLYSSLQPWGPPKTIEMLYYSFRRKTNYIMVCTSNEIVENKQLLSQNRIFKRLTITVNVLKTTHSSVKFMTFKSIEINLLAY